MIFVTVGTHEQQFNRLIEYMDKWAAQHDEEVVIQSGYSTYRPKYCEFQKLYAYQEIMELVEQARIVITHGGPSSFIMPLQIGKTPIVVPREKKFAEHVNDHQLTFSKAVADRMGTIIVVEDLKELAGIISNYDEKVKKMGSGIKSNNAEFNANLSNIVNEMFGVEN